MNETFIIRTYSYKELAMMYFPFSNPKAATVQLKRWLDLNESLQKDLLTAGYRNGIKLLTPLQVYIIIRYLGFPFREIIL